MNLMFPLLLTAEIILQRIERFADVLSIGAVPFGFGHHPGGIQLLDIPG